MVTWFEVSADMVHALVQLFGLSENPASPEAHQALRK